MSQRHQYAVRETLLELRVREEPIRTWVTPVGELDLSTTDALDRCLWDVQTHSERVALDLRALAFIDSIGLRSVLAAQLRAVKWHHRLEVVCRPGQVRRMFSLSGFDQLINIIEPSAPLHTHGAETAAA